MNIFLGLDDCGGSSRLVNLDNVLYFEKEEDNTRVVMMGQHFLVKNNFKEIKDILRNQREGLNF